jgi:hypothetical protein
MAIRLSLTASALRVPRLPDIRRQMEDVAEARDTRQAGGGWRGGALSLLLHGLMLLLALAYLAHRPALSPVSFRTLPVEIVVGQAGTPGPSTTEASPRAARARAQQPAAPRKEGVSLQGTKQPLDELSAKLRALAALSQPDDGGTAAATSAGGGQGSGAGAYTLRDFVRAQILRRWLPDLSARQRDLPVTLRVRLLASGTIDDVTIMDAARMKTDAAFHDMALSARNAAILASPLALPPGHYPRVQDLTITLDPKAVLK